MTKRLKHHKEARDGGRFLALSHSVIDSPAYRGLSYPAKALMRIKCLKIIKLRVD